MCSRVLREEECSTRGVEGLVELELELERERVVGAIVMVRF